MKDKKPKDKLENQTEKDSRAGTVKAGQWYCEVCKKWFPVWEKHTH